jgi:hypothetical protein
MEPVVERLGREACVTSVRWRQGGSAAQEI